jgi:hypothetical protein
MDYIQIFIAILTLLGGFFGLPKLIESSISKYKKNRIKRLASKYAKRFVNPSHSKDNSKFLEKQNKIFDDFRDLLWRTKDTIKDKKFLQKQLDEMILRLYDSGKQQEIINLKDEFENDFEFSEVSWVNIAISYLNYYNWNGLKVYRDKSIEACNKSIDKSPNFGTPRAVTLIIFMVDYDMKKEIDLNNIKYLINEINAGSDKYISYYSYLYLEDMLNKEAWKKYVDYLFELCPEEMNNMKNRYNEYSLRIK